MLLHESSLFSPRACKEKNILTAWLWIILTPDTKLPRTLFLNRLFKAWRCTFCQGHLLPAEPRLKLSKESQSRRVLWYEQLALSGLYMCGAPPGCGGEKSPSTGLSGDVPPPPHSRLQTDSCFKKCDMSTEAQSQEDTCWIFHGSICTIFCHRSSAFARQCFCISSTYTAQLSYSCFPISITLAINDL